MTGKSRVAAQLDTLRTQLEKERDEILRTTSPLYKKREALVAKIQPLELELRKIDDEIKAAEAPMYDVGNGLAQLARAGGARVISNGEPAAAPKAK